MIERRPFNEFAGEDRGWLKAKHHFSFAGGGDPARMGWGSLCVWNDDELAPNAGFPSHAHANMEIITYVRTGAVTHRDSLGSEGRTEAGNVQVMSAGTVSGTPNTIWNKSRRGFFRSGSPLALKGARPLGRRNRSPKPTVRGVW